VTERIARLRRRSLETEPSVSAERALLVTRVYRDEHGKQPTPVLRALALQALCEHQTLHLGDDELIVGQRGPGPKVVPTYPELTCHSLDDLRLLASRQKTRYRVDPEVLHAYRDEVIPYWSGRTMRERIFALVPRPGSVPTPPACSPSSWSSAPQGTPPSTTRSTERACWRSAPRSRQRGRLLVVARIPKHRPRRHNSTRWTSPARP